MAEVRRDRTTHIYKSSTKPVFARSLDFDNQAENPVSVELLSCHVTSDISDLPITAERLPEDDVCKLSARAGNVAYNLRISSDKIKKLPAHPEAALTTSPSNRSSKQGPLQFANSMQALLQKGKAFLTPSGSSSSLRSSGFRTEKTAIGLFPATDPAVDGEDCLHDCSSCTVELPKKWSIDEDDKLYGHVNGWETHLVVGTGKTDWVRDVTDEKGSLMEEVGKIGFELKNGKLMLSASDMPTGNHDTQGEGYGSDGQARCLVLPGWEMVDGVGKGQARWLLEEMIGKGVHNSTPLDHSTLRKHQPEENRVNGETVVQQKPEQEDVEVSDMSGLSMAPSHGSSTQDGHKSSLTTPYISKPPGVIVRPCPHRAVILMCSHGTRDWRCGKSAPLLRKEFERHLRPLGLFRDVHDERPGGVGIYFINHVGGHKYSANIMIYRRQGRKKNGSDEEIDGAPLSPEAVQGIWLARVRPEDCENIVKYTVLQGKLVKPQRQLRGGFDRERGLLSW